MEPKRKTILKNDITFTALKTRPRKETTRQGKKPLKFAGKNSLRGVCKTKQKKQLTQKNQRKTDADHKLIQWVEPMHHIKNPRPL